MKFVKYNSIENSYRKKFLDQVKREMLHGGSFVVEEKAHGANFSLWINKDNEITAASRSGFLGEKELKGFYRADLVIEKYAESLKKLREAYVAIKKKDDLVLTLYGEIIGGSYPHPEVERDNDASKVQKGVFYCPHNDFYAFDIAIDGELISPSEATPKLKAFDFYYATPLFIGTLEQCLKYPNEFNTQIPKLFGLPEIENNIAEGVVIKPIDPKFTNGGSRVIFKNKTSKFQEKASERKSGSTPLEGVALEYFNQVSSYITENRLRNVLSKIGPVTSKDFGTIIKNFTTDYMEDFVKEVDNVEFEQLSKEEKKKATKLAQKLAAEMIRDNMINIIDGEF